MIDKHIIDDQKKTIHRLQQECTEKTNMIIALGDKLQSKEQQCEELKNTVMKKCPQCGEVYLTPIGAELYETIIKIKQIAEEQQIWNDYNRKFSETEFEDDIFAYNWSPLNQIIQICDEVLNDK